MYSTFKFIKKKFFTLDLRDLRSFKFIPDSAVAF